MSHPPALNPRFLESRLETTANQIFFGLAVMVSTLALMWFWNSNPFVHYFGLLFQILGIVLLFGAQRSVAGCVSYIGNTAPRHPRPYRRAIAVKVSPLELAPPPPPPPAPAEGQEAR